MYCQDLDINFQLYLPNIISPKKSMAILACVAQWSVDRALAHAVKGLKFDSPSQGHVLGLLICPPSFPSTFSEKQWRKYPLVRISTMTTTKVYGFLYFSRYSWEYLYLSSFNSTHTSHSIMEEKLFSKISSTAPLDYNTLITGSINPVKNKHCGVIDWKLCPLSNC